VCDACACAKAHQLPFPVSSSHSSAPLELVFSDVWASAIDSFGRKNIILVSLMTIVNSPRFTCFTTNLKFLSISLSSKNLLNDSIARLLKFNLTRVASMRNLIHFFCSIGISSHCRNGSCACHPCFHAIKILEHWDEAFLVATYLINRTQTKLLSYYMPLQELLGATPDYFHFRVFGCACWPNLRPYNSHKLQHCSIRCVFLGYSNIHEGFKCLDISKGRIYISRDLIFNESVFPFASLHSTAGPVTTLMFF
jgi:hypothetical protein